MRKQGRFGHLTSIACWRWSYYPSLSSILDNYCTASTLLAIHERKYVLSYGIYWYRLGITRLQVNERVFAQLQHFYLRHNLLQPGGFSRVQWPLKDPGPDLKRFVYTRPWKTTKTMPIILFRIRLTEINFSHLSRYADIWSQRSLINPGSSL